MSKFVVIYNNKYFLLAFLEFIVYLYLLVAHFTLNDNTRFGHNVPLQLPISNYVMFCQYQYYRWNTEELQTAVAHSDGKYQCEEMSDCPYTGTTVINKIPWAGESDDTQTNEAGETEE